LDQFLNLLFQLLQIITHLGFPLTHAHHTSAHSQAQQT
jgi:hypothetical protein